MKKKNLKELFKKKRVLSGCAVLIAAAVLGGIYLYQTNTAKDVPELVSYVDTWEDQVSIGEDEVPLADSPNTTTKTSTKTSTKNVTMSKAAVKTYTKTLPAVTKTSTKTSTSGGETVKKVTTVKTSKTEKYTKKSKIKKVTTKVTTTVKTTVLASIEVEDTASGSGGMSLADERVTSAYDSLGFAVKYNASAPYSGHFDARSRCIILKKKDDTIYHELGHFVAFASGNTDKSAAFQRIYNSEKEKYTSYNKSYVTKSAEEYFAESFKDYTLNPSVLKQNRPKTYEAIAAAISKITDAQVTRIKTVYGPVWNS